MQAPWPNGDTRGGDVNRNVARRKPLSISVAEPGRFAFPL